MTELEFNEVKAHFEEIASNFSWYSDLLGQKTGNDVPLITAEVLEKNYYLAEAANDMIVYRTSGTSSGQRKQILYNDFDESRYLKNKTLIFKNFLDKSIVPLKKVLCDMGTGHAANTGTTIFGSLGFDTRSISFEKPVEEHITELVNVKPNVLYTMPSILDRIIHAADAPKEMGIKKIILTGEIASSVWQEKIAETFGINRTDILDTYGSIELGVVGYFNHDEACYVIADDIIAEGVRAEEIDPTFSSLDDNERVLVITSTIRSAFPAVRFVTYDVVRNFKKKLINGESKYTFEAVVKRIGKEYKHGEKISFYDIESIVYKHLTEAIIQVNIENNELYVDIQSKELNDTKIADIRANIANSIPEIAKMIENGLINEIKVNEHKGLSSPTGKIKNKVILKNAKSERLLKLIDELTPEAKKVDHVVSLSDKLKEDLGFDSIKMLRLLVELEKQFGFNIADIEDDLDLEDIESVEDILEYI